MKRIFFAAMAAAAIVSCNNTDKTAGSEGSKNTKDTTYQAYFPGDFSQEVSDADVNAVMMSYKVWENGDMVKVQSYLADSVHWESPTGEISDLTAAELAKRWGTYRDSLSSVVIKMDAWDRAYDTVKKASFVLVWYKEYDTYKSGKVDSSEFHDVNGVKDGKINYFSQYRKPIK